VSQPALGFLLQRSTRNRALHQFRRLRQPRYVIALLIGVGYLVLLGQNNHQGADRTGLHGPVLELGFAAGLLLMVAWTWISTERTQVLAFTTAEVSFLFPAPLSRAALIRFKLLRAQVLIVLTTIFWVVVLGAGRGELAFPLRAVSLWCLFTTVYLHRLGAAITRSSALESGRFGVKRQWWGLAMAGIAVVLVIGGVVQAGYRFISAPTGTSTLAAIEAALAAPLARIVLAPFRLLTHPLAAASTHEWLRAIPWALLLLGVHYLWVIRADAAFEEAAMEASFARARMLAARKAGTILPRGDTGYSPPLVRLTPTGPPARAIFWKNVAMQLRRKRVRTWGGIAVVLAMVLAFVSATTPAAAQAVGMLLLVWSGFLFVLGSQWVRNDLRSDLAHLELLRSFPLEPDAVVRMEAAASAFILSLGQLLLLLLAGLGFLHLAETEWTVRARILLVIAAVCVLPALNLVGLLLLNGAALLFPGWARVGPARGGIETLGQSMLTALAYILALGVACLVPALAAIGALMLSARLLHEWGLLPAIVAATALLLAEAWILSLWLGTIYERLDPPAVDAPAS
jgi:hypothetical protein